MACRRKSRTTEWHQHALERFRHKPVQARFLMRTKSGVTIGGRQYRRDRHCSSILWQYHKDAEWTDVASHVKCLTLMDNDKAGTGTGTGACTRISDWMPLGMIAFPECQSQTWSLGTRNHELVKSDPGVTVVLASTETDRSGETETCTVRAVRYRSSHQVVDWFMRNVLRLQCSN